MVKQRSLYKQLIVKALSAVMVLLFILQANMAAAQTMPYQYRERDSLLMMQYDEIEYLKERFVLFNKRDSIKRANLLQQFNTSNQDRSIENRIEFDLDSLSRTRKTYRKFINKQIDSIRLAARGAPVLVNRDTVFQIYTFMGPYSPGERAWGINQKIDMLISQQRVIPEEIAVVRGEESVNIMYRDVLLHTTIEKDAEWIDMRRSVLADQYAESIRVAIGQYNDHAINMKLVKQIGLILLILLVMGLLIIWLNRSFNWLFRRMMTKSHIVLKYINFENFQLLSEEQAAKILRWILNILKWPVILIILYFVLPLIFGIFPQTRRISAQLIELAMDPLRKFGVAFVEYMPELITIVLILLITRFILRLIKYFAREVSSERLKVHGFYPDWAMPTYNLVRLTLYAFAFVMIFPLLPGSHSPIFKGVSIFIGVLISLGSSSAVGNMIAGLITTYMRAFQIGDRVRINEATGEVIEKTILVTRIRTNKNEDVTIPNATILNSSTINYSSASADHGLILNSAVTIGYDVPWREVHQLLISAAELTDHVHKSPKPFVLQTSLDDFYVSYQINAYTDKPKLSPAIYSQLHCNIQDAFRDAGVEIMSPHYRANREGDASTIPV